MNAPPPTVKVAIFIFALGLSVLVGRADEIKKPDEAEVRNVIAKSLVFLDQQADKWMNERDCNSCHTMPELLWSHRSAQRRGFAVDQEKFDEYVDWSLSRAKKSKAADETTALLALGLPEQASPELIKLIAASQKLDGSWKLGGQFSNMQRREEPEATGNSLRLFLLALGTDKDPATADASRARAAVPLEKCDPAKSVETLVFRSLYARRFGSPEAAASTRAEILQLQHADGGWGWMVAEPQSDSLATGQVLYLLQQSPDAASAGAIARAQDWLVSHQREDGGWSIDINRISRLDRSGPAKAKSFQDGTAIYTFWGSAWATIGLVEGFPITGESHDAKAPEPRLSGD